MREPKDATASAVLRMPMVLLTAVAAVVAPSPAQAQSTIELPSEPPCRTCRVIARQVARLGTTEGPGSFETFITRVVADRRGRVYVAQQRSGVPVLAFDTTGTFVNTIGQAGRGPGEFTWVEDILPTVGDTLLIYDSENARLTVYSPSWQLVRTIPFPPLMFRLVRLDNGAFVANAVLNTPAQFGLPLHRVSPGGRIESSFGMNPGPFRSEQRPELRRWIARGSNNTIWSATEYRYEIEQWTADGERVAHIIRTPEWFRPRDPMAFATLDRAPPPWLTAVHQDRTGLIWLLVAVPRDDWRRGVTPMRGELGMPTYLYRWEWLYDTMVDVIDVEGGRLVASTRLSAFILHFADDGLVAGYMEDDAGRPFLSLWRLTLAR